MVKKILPFGAQKFHLNGKEGQELKSHLTVKAKIFLGAIAMLTTLVLVVVMVSIFGVGTAEKDYWFPRKSSYSELGLYSRAAIATDAEPCATIGRQILEKNGSAVDSAIAMLLCMGAVNPQSQGLGGGFLMVIYNKRNGTAIALDARETAPGMADKDMFEGKSNNSRIGGLSIAVPGELAGYAKAHEKFGKLPWADLFQPTIKLCKDGIVVSAHLAEKLKLYSKAIKERPVLRTLFTKNMTGGLVIENDIIFRPDLARTLEILASDGKNALYDPNHHLAKTFMQDLKNMGSIITPEDLASYEARWQVPITIKLENNATLYSSPLPGSGVLLASLVNIMHGYNVTRDVVKNKEDTVLTMHRMIEAFKFTYAKRMYLEDDSVRLGPLLQNITSPEYADWIRSLIDDDKTYENTSHYQLPRDTIGAEDHGTAHVTVVGPDGDVVSVTSTINQYFGSFEMSESTGILLNNEMDDFSNPNIISYFDVPPSPYNHVVPGRRPLSSMCPTIVVSRDGNVRLALGGNGGTKIITSVFQVLLRNLWLGDDIKTSIDGARFHHQLLPNELMYERDFPQEMRRALEKKGHKDVNIDHGMVGIVMGIARIQDGRLSANSDYRKKGGVAGF